MFAGYRCAGDALERRAANLHHLDGADFGPAQEARKELCEHIVTDERRSDGPKAARPGGVATGSPSDSVAQKRFGLDRVPDPLCSTLLAEKLPKAITVMQIYRTPL
jgi:hypothetical protein